MEEMNELIKLNPAKNIVKAMITSDRIQYTSHGLLIDGICCVTDVLVVLNGNWKWLSTELDRIRRHLLNISIQMLEYIHSLKKYDSKSHVFLFSLFSTATTIAKKFGI